MGAAYALRRGCTMAAQASSRRGAAAAVAFCIAALVVWTPRAQPAEPAPKRIGFSILEDYDKGDDLADVAKDFALFQELGITTWRGSFGWDDYEPSRRHYDFAWLHRFADLASRYGITLRPYIGYTPAWAAGGGTDTDVWNDPPRNPDDWSRFVRALASAMRRHRNIASYEIYNEEDVAQWWDGPFTAYNDVVRRAADAIRAAAPGTQVLLGGMVYPDNAWVRHVCVDGRNGPRLDIVPFHAYPETWTPADVDLERYLGPHFGDGFVREVDQDCGRKPIWINETGYATVGGRSEHDQADWWVRAIAMFTAQPRVEHIGVYEIKDLEPTRTAIGDAPNYHLGITRTDRTKKLAFQTVRMMVALFSRPIVNEAPSVTGSTGADLFSYAFRRDDGREIVVAWVKSTEQTVDVSVRQAARTAVEHHFDGSTSEYAPFDGRTLRGVALHPGTARIFELVP
jgi:polysaccharide biosynthesis protein PslG